MKKNIYFFAFSLNGQEKKLSWQKLSSQGEKKVFFPLNADDCFCYSSISCSPNMLEFYFC